jgi:glycine cleavage system H protein
MSNLPETLHYSEDHLWVTVIETPLVRCGITYYAQDLLNEVVVVRPPDVGSLLTAGQQCGEIESTKTISELISPVTGTVERTNTELIDAPELVNSEPYGKGWILEVRLGPDPVDAQLVGLMDASQYQQFLDA